MKFAHLADCHIGGWKDEKLAAIGLKTFELALNECISRNIDFILISGDLFNTALPNIDYIKEVARLLKLVKDSEIKIYTIAGSHDYSVSGKTMLDVLENAGLIQNAARFDNDALKFIIDPKSNAKITGLYGKKGGLERYDYEALNRKNLENEQGFKIFMFHSGIKEFMPAGLEDIDSLPINALPANFNYYAGGHIHYVFQKKTGNSLLMFPGALFPNNFKELEEFNHGGFYIVDDSLKYEFIKINAKDVLSIAIDANNKTPDEVTSEVLKYEPQSKDKIVTIRIEGILKEGKPSDINFRQIMESFSDAYCVVRNTSKLAAKDFKIMEVKEENIEDIEKAIITENNENILLFGDYTEKSKFVNDLIETFSLEKQEGEKSYTFEEKLVGNITKLFSKELENDNKQNKIA